MDFISFGKRSGMAACNDRIECFLVLGYYSSYGHATHKHDRTHYSIDFLGWDCGLCACDERLLLI